VGSTTALNARPN
jgi:hypothetical protein